MLDIIASYQCVQFQGKLMNQTWENGKKPRFWLILPQICSLQIFFRKFQVYYMLCNVTRDHYMQPQGKLINQIWENSQKT